MCLQQTSMISFGDPRSGGTKAWTTLTNHFGVFGSVPLDLGPSEFALPASVFIEVSSRSFLPAGLLFPECPQPPSNRLSPWRASCFGVRRVLRAHVSLRATGGHDRRRDWSHPVVQLCVEKVPLTIRLSSRGQKYIFSTARIISSPWRVFPAGRTRHDSCSPGSGRGRGQVWMVVLGNQPVQPCL